MTNEAYDNSTILDPRIAERLKRDDKGLVAAVIQQFDTKEVLMVGYMNDEAIRRTLMTGRVTFWSRSRQEYWRKGDTSGHAQYVKSFALDCDGDAILVEVDQVGAACHTGKRSCFEEGGQLPHHSQSKEPRILQREPVSERRAWSCNGDKPGIRSGKRDSKGAAVPFRNKNRRIRQRQSGASEIPPAGKQPACRLRRQGDSNQAALRCAGMHG